MSSLVICSCSSAGLARSLLFLIKRERKHNNHSAKTSRSAAGGCLSSLAFPCGGVVARGPEGNTIRGRGVLQPCASKQPHIPDLNIGSKGKTACFRDNKVDVVHTPIIGTALFQI